MNSRVSWSIEGIDPSVRERAEAAARRAGMSLNDWINSTVGNSAPPDFRDPFGPRPMMPDQKARDVDDIHQRLDAITRQIEQISRPVPRRDHTRSDTSRGESAVARQLNDAISRLDARLSQISNPQASPQSQLQDLQRQAEVVERAAAKVYRASPPLSPASFDSVIAEIAARQNELDGPPLRPAPPRGLPPIAPDAPPMAPSAPAAPTTAPGPDFSSLERYLVKITSQIEALQRPDHVEQSIAAFRIELAEIRQAITEAMPRRAVESLEAEIRSLSRRIDDNRQNGNDGQMLAGIERALSEIHEVLRSLTPAEQLAGFDEAIRNLGAKLDLILRSNDDPSTVHQLEGAIAALRTIVANIASNEALARLSEDVHMLSAKVDQLARTDGRGDSFAMLEQRIAALTSSLESRERPAASENSQQLEDAIRSLSERIDRMQIGTDSTAAFAHLEQRVSYLLERLEASSEHRSGNLGRVEEGLQDILRHLERQHANLVALAEATRNNNTPSPQQVDGGLVDMVKRELSDIRYSQSETDRRTQDSLETVHNTLGHVVDRLSMIEGDLRTVRSAPVAPLDAGPTAAEPPRAASPHAIAPQDKPELPNPAAQEHFVAAAREFQAAMPQAAAAVPPVPPRAISEILEPHAAASRAAIEPDLPPDHPLEPGTRPTARMSSPTERIAASEDAISEISTGKKEPVSTSSFIAAARRAAQAAAAQAASEKGGRAAAKSAAKTDKTGLDGKESSTITSKIRSLLVGASVVVIVLGTFKMAMTLLDTGGPAQAPSIKSSSEPANAAPPPADNVTTPAPAPAGPSMTSPTPIGRQSNNTAAPNTLDSAPLAIAPASAPAAPPVTANDVTGSIPARPAASAGGKIATVQVPPNERLPDGIGGPVLRTAAMKGDPAAAYEVAVRFAEGRGVPTDFDEAAKWYDRAAQAGVVPATFRLGTLYEKGLGVRRDVDIARRYYIQSAESGNAKAMHNLAVLDADGGGKGADYKSAAQWFRKAADRGVADSQYNLGILYARGIGVEQNLAESFKWFSLAAAQGDADAGRKRDDIAKRLDPQSLAAAKLAIQTFTAEPQPDDAINVASPPGGWDAATIQPTVAKPAARPTPRRTAAVMH
jgi:localization factor PodJL